jgi:hypothetical protein
LARQAYHVIQELLQGCGLDQVGPAQQGRVIRCPLQAQAAELPQHQAVIDEVLGLGVAPAIQPTHNQQPQEDFERGRWPTGLQRVRPSSSEIPLDRSEECVILQQLVKLSQHRLELQRQCRRQREQIDRRIPVS